MALAQFVLRIPKRTFTASVIFLFLISACSKPRNKPDKPGFSLEKARERLKKYFETPIVRDSSKDPISGVWEVDSDDMIRVMKQKFLSRYKAKPDETSAKIIEKRLTKTQNFLKFNPDGTAIMMSIAYNGVPGGSGGRWRYVSSKEASVMWRGNGRMLKATIRLLDANTILYEEKVGKMRYHRFQKNAEQVIEQIVKKLKDDGSLPEY